ncbi:hypothetical protein L596_015271 [Steinernema carpocapsae]|uniref:Uncharacterized protein n=1 Tax=Steinernema carpocapsae TaxID=34508 RepID=A0A4U5NEG8_STECR|nr:hypothetical protein L596_015271 [Steinernema carpocapsae]
MRRLALCRRRQQRLLTAYSGNRCIANGDYRFLRLVLLRFRRRRESTTDEKRAAADRLIYRSFVVRQSVAEGESAAAKRRRRRRLKLPPNVGFLATSSQWPPKDTTWTPRFSGSPDATMDTILRGRRSASRPTATIVATKSGGCSRRDTFARTPDACNHLVGVVEQR